MNKIYKTMIERNCQKDFGDKILSTISPAMFLFKSVVLLYEYQNIHVDVKLNNIVAYSWKSY